MVKRVAAPRSTPLKSPTTHPQRSGKAEFAATGARHGAS
jgi:hypothetical protein